MTCLFCQIAQGDIPAQIIYRDEKVVAFRDINPQAPQHVLIIPHEHIATLNDLNLSHRDLMIHLLLTAKQLAQQEGIATSGYRTVFNCNADAGQTVFHLHLHLLGGRPLAWPPG